MVSLRGASQRFLGRIIKAGFRRRYIEQKGSTVIFVIYFIFFLILHGVLYCNVFQYLLQYSIGFVLGKTAWPFFYMLPCHDYHD